MTRYRWPGLTTLFGAALLLATLGNAGADEKKAGGAAKDGHDAHAAHFDECAKACANCMRECERCANHCAKLTAQGSRGYLETLGTCLDCSEFCAASAKITSRRGPMAGLICEQCAKACDMCRKACERYRDDEHMTRCAQACRDCAASCREMLKHVDHVTATKRAAAPVR